MNQEQQIWVDELLAVSESPGHISSPLQNPQGQEMD